MSKVGARNTHAHTTPRNKPKHSSTHSIMPIPLVINVGFNASRAAYKRSQRGNIKDSIDEVLEDGSTVLCCAEVEVAKAYRMSVSTLPAPDRNLGALVKEKARGKDKRIFMAVRTPSGDDTLLLLLKQPTNSESDGGSSTDEDVENRAQSIEKTNLDTGFTEGLGRAVPSLDSTVFTERKAGVFRLSPRKSMPLQSAELYDLTVRDAQAIEWFNEQVARSRK